MKNRLLLLPLIALFHAACAAPQASLWDTEVVLDAGVKLGGCAVGDLVPEQDGDEIAAVGENGEVFVLTRSGSSWKSEMVAQFDGEMIQCAIGDADPRRPGAELAVVGMVEGDEDSGGPGAAHLLYRDDNGEWQNEMVFEDSALIHGVWAGSGVMVVTGFSRSGQMLRRGRDGWESELITELPGPGKAAVKTEFGVAFACADGAVVMARRFDDGWRSTEIDRRGAGRARLGTDNARILVADDDGVLSLIGRDGTDLVLRDSGKLRGAVLAELDPRGEGLEAATAGYNRRVIVVRRIDGSWSPEVIYEDADKLHHLSAAELDDDPGVELVTCGFGGRVVILHRRR